MQSGFLKFTNKKSKKTYIHKHKTQKSTYKYKVKSMEEINQALREPWIFAEKSKALPRAVTNAAFEKRAQRRRACARLDSLVRCIARSRWLGLSPIVTRVSISRLAASRPSRSRTSLAMDGKVLRAAYCCLRTDVSPRWEGEVVAWCFAAKLV